MIDGLETRRVRGDPWITRVIWLTTLRAIIGCQPDLVIRNALRTEHPQAGTGGRIQWWCGRALTTRDCGLASRGKR